MTTAQFCFDEITAAKDRLFPSRYTYTKYTPPGTGRLLTEPLPGPATPIDPVVVELGPPTGLAGDAEMDEIKCHVSYIQSSAHRFRKYRDQAALETLLNASDTLSAYLLDLDSAGRDPAVA